MIQKNILLLCYSVSQARLLKAFVQRVPEPSILTVVSFNDGDNVNSQISRELSSLPVTFMALADFAARNAQEGGGNRVARGTITFDHSYTDMLVGQLHTAHLLLAELKPDLVIVVEDGPGGCDSIIKAANLARLPVVIMPFGVGEDRDYEIFIDQKHEEGNLNLVPDGPIGDALRLHAQKWVRQTPYGDITLFPAEFVLARIAAGLDLPFPWLVQGGTADALMVESEAMRRIYVREGVPVEKLKLVGSIYADVVHDEMQRSNHRAGGASLSGAKARILLSLPPSYHNEKSRTTEFQTYEETIDRIVTAIQLSAPDADIVVSLHPAASADTLDVIRKTGVEISERWILEEIGSSDVFISTFSSTTRWAVAAKAFVLNYDMYSFDLQTYNTVPHFLSFNRVADMAAKLRDIMDGNEEVLARYREMFNKAGEWGMMDGRNFERIWQYLSELIEERA